jgi:hypothetical protein
MPSSAINRATGLRVYKLEKYEEPSRGGLAVNGIEC